MGQNIQEWTKYILCKTVFKKFVSSNLENFVSNILLVFLFIDKIAGAASHRYSSKRPLPKKVKL